MLDQSIHGRVDRISPEAPVPVLQKEAVSEAPGGAANVAMNVVALAGEASLYGVVGDDGAGQRLCDLLHRAGVGTRGVLVDASRPTTVKTRIVADDQQLLRIDDERKDPIGSVIRRDMLDRLQEDVEHADCVVISDYGKGVVSSEVSTALVETAHGAAKRAMVDPYGPDYRKYRGADILKLNLPAARSFAWSTFGVDASLADVAQRIRSLTGCALVIITKGKDGAVLCDSRDFIEIPTTARAVYDVTGAGDTFFAMFAVASSLGLSDRDAAAIANVAAAVVVEKIGTATVNQFELQAELKKLGMEDMAPKSWGGS